MKKRGIFSLAAAVLFVWATSNVASASVLTPQYDTTPPTTDINTISGWDTTGMDMNGMQVSVNSGAPVTWSNGVAAGAGWALTMVDGFQGSPFATGSTEWWGLELTVTDPTLNIDNLVINALPGNAVFDVDPHIDFVGPNPSTGLDYSTPGSRDGKPIAPGYTDWNGDASVQMSAGLNVQATYSQVISFLGATYEDLYGTLTLNFYDNTGAPIAFTSNDSLYFVSDTDNLRTPSVPEPATLLLFGIGIAGLVGCRRKNN